MGRSITAISFYFGTLGLILSSCKKEIANTSTPPINPTPPVVIKKPPVANAGADLTVNYDLQTCSCDPVTLNGSGSYHTDGSIVSFFWRGDLPVSNPDSVITTVNIPAIGIYKFFLWVIDSNGKADSDTVIVNVTSGINRPTINASLFPIGTLSQARTEIAVGTAGSRIVFAGGITPNFGVSSRVDIYDINTGVWTMTELSKARFNIGVAVLGTRIFFAGGSEGGSWDYTEVYSNVDIYDAESNSWTVAHLSEARGWIAATSVGNKVLFGGGTNSLYLHSARVDIYDLLTNTWSKANLSEARSYLTAEAVNNKVYFAGGQKGSGNLIASSHTIDIFDNSTGSWSTSSLTESKLQMKSIAFGNRILWAGGVTGDAHGSRASGLVEIRDLNTNTSSIGCLSQPAGWEHNSFHAFLKDNSIVFYPGPYPGVFDIFNPVTGMWTIGSLNKRIGYSGSIVVNNSLFVAGAFPEGGLSNQVWKLEF